MSFREHLTECGIPGIRDIPRGLHFCHFYSSRQELADILVPFFAAGLRSNERCIWVTADPLPSKDARAALARAVPGLDALLEQGALRIVDYRDWYTRIDGLKGGEVLGVWLEEERAALAEGYEGLRVSGNTSFLTAEDWDEFLDYERAVNEALPERRIIALCSYGLQHRGAVEKLDVVLSHKCAIHRSESHWQVLSKPEPWLSP